MQKHLSNKDIQRFLDSDVTENENLQFSYHLNRCNQCGSELETYREIYRALETEEDYTLSVNFTQSVISQLSSQQIPVRKERWSDSIFAFAGIIVSLVVSIYYLGSAGFAPFLNGLQQYFQKLNMISSNIDSLYLDLIMSPYLVAFVGIITVILILERFVLNKKVLHFI